MKELTKLEKNRILKDFIICDFFTMKADFNSALYIKAVSNTLKATDYDSSWLQEDLAEAIKFFSGKYIHIKPTKLEAIDILDSVYPS